MAADSRGYYAQLGLSPGASIDVVRAVYRQLAKECHPDRPGCNDGGERFRKITEAYEALSDLAFKAAYDSGEQARGEEENSEQATQIDPVLCQVCGRVTAQPRRLAFWRVTSLILASQKNPIQRIYCRDCAGKEQWKSTIWTSLLGWWGIPWGPVWAIQHGVMNAIGGSREEKVDEALMWQNAIAFAMRGEGQLAVGLSNILRKSDDAEIGQKSAEIIRFFADRGVDPRSTLADVWRRSIWRTAALFGIAFAVPAAAVAIIVIPASNVQESYSAPSDATDAPNNLESSGETSGLPATETSSESATP
ncbi:MAG TPA: J domain-containing protein, partial [Sphingomicrobium sp.]